MTYVLGCQLVSSSSSNMLVPLRSLKSLTTTCFNLTFMQCCQMMPQPLLIGNPVAYPPLLPRSWLLLREMCHLTSRLRPQCQLALQKRKCVYSTSRSSMVHSNEVTRVTPNAVELKLPKTLRIHPVVNVSRVKPYLGPLPGQPVSWPGPVQVSEECDEEYEVDYIVASRIYGRQLQYLVHWKGYEEHEHTWEPASNVKNAPLEVERFYKENPSAPRKLCMAQLDFDSLFKPVPENLTICEPQFCSLESCS